MLTTLPVLRLPGTAAGLECSKHPLKLHDAYPPAYIALDISTSCTVDQTRTLLQTKLS